jgi:hypothetical protein
MGVPYSMYGRYGKLVQHLVIREGKDNGPLGRLGVGERIMCAAICCGKVGHNLSFSLHICYGDKQGDGWLCSIYGSA